ncbi:MULTISPECIES: RAQPRD family integrative conjugative element protein [Pseudomonas]|uniref:integrative conjugative element protein, RAQPRD family n=1 Tax=Pseudomonas TaxID=286 RepID=UPI0004662997|nr:MULTISPECIES: RAQPRD family integrative conjugative element protein [Pseudomonas]MBG6332424.1 RAQPRD family integrative conjugative element protein [Pseudomonas aeruginosa]TEK52814.1 raqprd family integrative conjugative element protein [Pseudomonas aeruginosa]TEK59264.1 raqprd family integrative conjugative element protein [Pseudomonas aeruginosa]TEK71396.1 raqprd family integrative conjugative element protein [Pseudomonas aeruginosa]TEK86222.1 raqprd family integrative conjugative element
MARFHNSAYAWRRPVVALLLTSIFITQLAAAADDGYEREHLAAVARQLDLLDRLAKQSASTAPESRSRYHFDYRRLDADLQRMRSGINDYLTPQRAQPRDPSALLGDYRQDAEQEDDR